MSKALSVLVAAAALAVTPLVYGADAARTDDRKSTREETQQQQQEAQVEAPAPITLEQLLAEVPEEPVLVETADGVSATVTQHDVLIARMGADGKPVMACVDSPEAARRFLHATVEKLTPKQAKEQ
jgi:hypothetical protein